MKVVSYNLRKHRAIAELAALDERYSPDLICLQEVETTGLAEEVGRLQLAHSTTRNRLGLASDYRARPLRAARRASVRAEEVAPRPPPLARRTNASWPCGCSISPIRRESVVASFHAAPLTALSSPRLHQIRSRAPPSCSSPRPEPADAHGPRLQLPRLQGQPGPRRCARPGNELLAERSDEPTPATSSSAATSTSQPPSASTSTASRTLPRGRPTTCRSWCTRTTRGCPCRRPTRSSEARIPQRAAAASAHLAGVTDLNHSSKVCTPRSASFPGRSTPSRIARPKPPGNGTSMTRPDRPAAVAHRLDRSAIRSSRGPARSRARPAGTADARSTRRSATSRAATGCERIPGTSTSGPTFVRSKICDANSWNCVARRIVQGTRPAATSSSCNALPA